MSERIFLRQNGVILGPFPAERIHAMLKCGGIAPGDELSSDKESWLPAEHFFVESLPEERVPDPEPDITPEPENKTDVENKPEETSSSGLKKRAAENSAGSFGEGDGAVSGGTVQIAVFPQGGVTEQTPRRLDWGADVIRQLWNAPEASARLAKLDRVGAGWWTLGLGLFLIAFGNLLFAGRYPVPRLVLWSTSGAFGMLHFFFAWGIFTLIRISCPAAEEARPAADFLTAATLALLGGAVHLMVVALAFLLLPEWAPNRLRLALPLLIGMLFTGLFAANAFLLVRRKMRKTYGMERFPAMAISLMLNTLCAYGYVEFVMLNFISNAGVTL